LPFPDDYHLADLSGDASSFLLINHAPSMAVIIESVRENGFIIRYLPEQGIQVREKEV